MKLREQYFNKAEYIGVIDDFSAFVKLEDYVPGFSVELEKDCLLSEAVALLKIQTDWEGDGNFYVYPDSVFSTDGYIDINLVVKQSNNGSTYRIYKER